MVEAVVRTGRYETAFARTGRGPHLLLLAAGTDGEAARALAARLAQRFRVFLPAVPDGVAAADLEGVAWLGDLIEGLGLDRPGVVAIGSLASLLERFTQAHPDRVERIAVIREPDEPGGASGPREAPAPGVSFTGLADERTLLALIAFLDGTG